MIDFPAPDHLDRRGRTNRLVIAVVCGVIGAVGAGYAMHALGGFDYERGNRGAPRLLFACVVAAFVIMFMSARMVIVRRDKTDRLPEARLERR